MLVVVVGSLGVLHLQLEKKRRKGWFFVGNAGTTRGQTGESCLKHQSNDKWHRSKQGDNVS